jgi:galactosylceramidase
MGSLSLLLLAFALLSARSATASSAAIAIDTSAAGLGPRYDSYGAISGGGATSRLLFQYDNATAARILDLLFLPKFGASLHHLKVEIGGDGQSSEGVEPSHLHADDAGAASYTRGYEWRLMSEARTRNPAILLSALAWTWPGWVGAGSHSPWTDNNKSVTYLVSWLKGAREVHGLELDYINADWNERGWSPSFVKALRAALDAQGFPLLKIVCGDDSHTYSCASAAAADPELRAAIAAFGSHGPQGPDPNVGGIPVWNTEIHAFEAGGTALAAMLPQGFIAQNITGGTSWNMLGAYNPGLFAPDSGIFRAWWPWCGYYEQLGQLWVWAHFMQATRPGMRFLRVGSGSGQTGGGAVYFTFYDEATRDVTLVVYAPAGAATEQAAFQLSGPGAAGVRALHAVRSLVVANAHPAPDVSGYFVAQPDVAVAADGSFSVPLASGVLWTLTTVAGMTKGVVPAPPPATPFPTSYGDDFDACAIEQEAAYFTDMTGSFECVPAAPPRSGVVMRQTVPMHPVAWRPEEQRPFSLFAADISWASTAISIDVLMAAGEGALVGVRANPNCCGRVITGEDLMPGVWLGLQAGSSSFSVWNSIANATSATGVLLRGTIAPAPAAGVWVTVQLNVTAAGVASAAVDGRPLFGGLSVQGKVADAGFAAIGTFDWGQYVAFDNLVVSGGAQ